MEGVLIGACNTSKRSKQCISAPSIISHESAVAYLENAMSLKNNNQFFGFRHCAYIFQNHDWYCSVRTHGCEGLCMYV